MIISDLSYNEKGLYVVDGFLEDGDVRGLYSYCREKSFCLAEYSFKDSSFSSYREGLQWLCLIDESEYCKFYLGRIEEVAKEIFPLKNLKLGRSHLSCVRFGDERYLHVDGGRSDEVYQLLLFISPRWKNDWGGETTFFKNNEAHLSISPAPGRLVIFHCSHPHRGGVPSQSAELLRYALTTKLFAVDKI